MSNWFPNFSFAVIFSACFVGWAGLEFVNHLIGKWGRLGQPQNTRDRGSYWLIIAIVYLLFGLASLARLFNVGTFTGPVQVVGLAIMLGGVVVRQWAIFTLGRHFSVVVAIEQDHQLVKTGPYRWLRHPAYTGGLTAMLGFHLALGTWITLLLTVVTLLPAFMYRISVEEQALRDAFAAEYPAYMRRTWRLFPGW